MLNIVLKIKHSLKPLEEGLHSNLRKPSTFLPADLKPENFKALITSSLEVTESFQWLWITSQRNKQAQADKEDKPSS